jgi:hypothetical protein
MLVPSTLQSLPVERAMNPDTAAAIPQLVQDGALPAAAAVRPLRVARGELLSVRAELRAVLYCGVLLITGGVGLLVAEHLQQIGPLTIAVGLAAAALVALLWVANAAPPFAWHETASPNLAFDYVLLLGVLLAAADLAYVEREFTPLGSHWPWHLLLVAAFAGAAAVRFDSRVVFSLALATFAAWRGLALSVAGAAAAAGWDSRLRANAVGCGLLFALLGLALERTRRKPHFAPAAIHLGWLLVLGGIASGLPAIGYACAIVAVGSGLAAGAWWRRRFSLFAFGVVAAACGAVVLIGHTLPQTGALGCFFISCFCIAVIGFLLGAYYRLGSKP